MKEWWYCNQSEYATYRLQFAHTKVETTVEGNRLLLVYGRGRDRAILFRLVSPDTRQRAADIRYELPKMAE